MRAAPRAGGGILCAALLAGCSSSDDKGAPGAPAVISQHRSGGYFADLRFIGDPQCAIDSVAVSGPGIGGTLSLVCDPASPAGPGWSGWVALPQPPPGPPVTYQFITVDGGKSRAQAAAIHCHMVQFAVPLEPSGVSPVKSPVALKWTMVIPVGGMPMEYTLYLGGAASARYSVVDKDSTTLALSPGYYQWALEVGPVGAYELGSTGNCAARMDGPSFTVEP